VQPPRKELNRHAVGVRWADLIEVTPLEPPEHVVQLCPQHVEIANHTALVQFGPLDNDLDPVLVLVRLALLLAAPR
jgi:hypothetical protein